MKYLMLLLSLLILDGCSSSKSNQNYYQVLNCTIKTGAIRETYVSIEDYGTNLEKCLKDTQTYLTKEETKKELSCKTMDRKTAKSSCLGRENVDLLYGQYMTDKPTQDLYLSGLSIDMGQEIRFIFDNINNATEKVCETFKYYFMKKDSGKCIYPVKK